MGISNFVSLKYFYSKSKLNFYFESVTNDTFLKVFQNNLIKSSVKPSSTSTLNSGFKLILDLNNNLFSCKDKYTIASARYP